MEQPVRFAVDGITLQGLVSKPSAPAHIGVVVCHPHPLRGGDMHNTIVSALVASCRAAGMTTLRFNFRGVGESTGEYDEGRGEKRDVAAAVDHLLSLGPLTRIAVAGYSFGALVGLEAGASDPRVHALVGVALPVAMRDAAFLRPVEKPALLVVGDRDDYAPVGKIGQLASAMATHASVTVVEGADHFFAGKESAVASAAVAFLSA
jgi:hypothetical protein